MGNAEAIAVIGLGARLPGAADAGQYWRNIRDSRESVQTLSDAELLANGVTTEELADPYYVRTVPVVPHIRDFDAELFGLTAREARICDPQLKLMLEVSHAALENAGLDPTTMNRDVGMFASTGQSRYADMYVHGRLGHHEQSLMALNNSDYVATFTSYKLDLHGPAFTVLSACSGSLVAVHLACQSLLTGECDLALAGGANVELPYGHGYRWGPGSVRSRDGHCRPFDAAASGTAFGDGAGAVVLKRLSDAVADHDHIRAVIHGSAVNNDGSEKMSFGAPSVARQTDALVQALSVAGIDPADISYVEAHGTGTAVGDPIEIAALDRAFRSLTRRALPAGSIPIGSVKGNIGHTVPTAGVAGLVKLAYALDEQQIPPSINVTEPNPDLGLATTPFFVNTALRPWARTDGRIRWAGLSALGVGGTNAHLVVSEGPAPVRTPHRDRPRIVVWSGRTAAAAEESRATLAEFFAGTPDESFTDAVATLQQGRTAHPVRAAVVATDPAGAAAALRDGTRVAATPDVSGSDGDPVFLFPGQGSQHARMAAGLYGVDQTFTDVVDRCLAYLDDGADLRDRWLGTDDEALRDTAFAQPLLFAVEYALAQVLLELGVRPAALVGHSVGELVAATLSGVFDVADAMRLTALRGRLMQEQPRGSMLAVRAGVEAVVPLLTADFSVAVVNGPDQTVVAGPAATDAVREILAAAGLLSRVVPTSHAFHTATMAGAVAPFAAGVAGVALREPTIPVYSAATGRLLTGEQAMDPEFWARQLAEPVRFDRAVDAALEHGAHLLVEVGPGQVLTGLMGRHPAVRQRRCAVVPMLPRADRGDRDDERALLEALASLWVRGRAVHWPALHPNEPLRRVPVPGYPYQRTRCWIDPTTGPAAPRTAGQEVPDAPDAAAATAGDPVVPVPASPFALTTWLERQGPPAAADAGGAYALALVPEDRSGSLPLVAALQRCGYRVVRVRPGDGYQAQDHEFRVRPGSRADLDRVLETLAARGQSPGLLVHGWAFDEWAPITAGTADEQLRLGFHGLHALVNAMGRAPSPANRLPAVLVVTSRAVDVSGGEPVQPAKATLLAQARTIAAETPGLTCRVVDLCRPDDDELADELRRPAADPVVALRAGRRWVPHEVPYELRPGTSPIRRDGVYLITGGLGGLGLAAARALAGTGLLPRLVLVGRSGLAPDDPRTAAIEEIEALGARVRVTTCDIADPRALARVLDITTARFGPVNGVLHLAGVAGDGMLAFRGRADADAVLRPKVRGTLVLREAFRDRPPLDLFVSFSSRAALAGMVGGGDYAAANAFLDTYASTERSGAGMPGRMLSIGWPAWRRVGMASALLDADPAAHGDDPAAVEYRTTLSARNCWALDEHRLAGRPVLPGTAHLDLAVRAFRAVLDARTDRATVLEDVAFTRPLTADDTREVRVRFTADGDRYRFEIGSRPDGTGEEWSGHVTGFIGLAADSAAARSGSVADLAAGMTETAVPRIDGSSRLFTLGPRWRTITGVWQGAAGKLVRLALPVPFRSDITEHPLHPTLLDSATASVREPEVDGLHLPFMYRRLVLHASLPAELHSHLRRRDGTAGTIVADIDLIGPDGTIVAEIEGFTMRRADPGTFATAAAPAASTGRTVRDRRADPAGGLEPELGARLLLDLLAAPTPAHVLVRPFRDGAPVPLVDAGNGSAPILSPAEVWAAAPGNGRPAPAAPPVPGADPADAGTAGGEGAVQDRLRALWADVLGTDAFAPDADFFDIGGDSMSAVELMGRIRDTFRVELSIGALFDHPTLAQLSAALHQDSDLHG